MTEKKSEPWTVARLLSTTRDYLAGNRLDAPRLTAEILLAHALDMPRLHLYLAPQRVPETTQLDEYRELVRKAAAHHPVQYLTGTASFFSLEFRVSPDVLVPRPETETLVEQAIGALRDRGRTPRILDLGTGSGCIAIALGWQLKEARLWATDLSAAALNLAEENARRHKLADRIQFRCGDLFAALSDEDRADGFDLIVANPPYIAEAQWPKLPPNVRDHEPKAALLAGMDGLEFHHRICEHAPDFLRDDGLLMLEVASDQGQSVRNLFMQSGRLANIKVAADAAGHDRVVIGVKCHSV